MDKNRLISIFIIIFGTSWLLTFPYYTRLWNSFILRYSNISRIAFQVFLVFFFIGLFLGTYIINVKNIKRLTIIGMVQIILLSIIMWILPWSQIYYAGYATLGAFTGLVYTSFAFILIFGFNHDNRARAVSLIMLGSYIVTFIFFSELYKLKDGQLFSAVTVLLVISAVLVFFFKTAELKEPKNSAVISFSYRTFFICGIILFISYFNSRLIYNITAHKAPGFSFSGNYSILVQASICIIIYILGKKLDVFAILMTALSCIGLTYLFAIIDYDLPFYLTYIASGALKDIFIYIFISNLAYKYGMNFNVLRLSIVFVALGSIIGQFSASQVYQLISGNNTKLYVTVLSILFISMTLVPWVSKLIRTAMTAGNTADTGEGIPTGTPCMEAEQQQWLHKNIADNEIQTTESSKEIIMEKYNLNLPESRRLTKREFTISLMLLERLDYKTISEKLYITENTLKTHIKHIYKKINVSSRKELINKINNFEI